MSLYGAALARFGAAPLFSDDSGRTASYADAAELAGRFAAAERGLLLLDCANTVPSALALVAAVSAGHAVLLLDGALDPATRARLAAAYDPDGEITADGALTWLRTRPLGGLHPELALLLPTSGSTGSPKMARFSQAQLAANADAIASYLGLAADDCPIGHLPVHYSFGLSILNSHMRVGARLALTRHSLMTREFWDRVRAAGATSFSGVPFHYEMLRRLRLERMDLPTLRMLTQAGGRMEPARVGEFAALAAARGWKFTVMYGQTEAGPRITWLPFDQVAAHPDSIGQPIPGARVELLDEAGQPGDAGELVCHSPSVMMGYAHGRADLALGDVMGGRLATGDLARRDAQGLLRITGRLSRFVKLQGVRVNLDEVEKRLHQLGHPVVCVGEDDLLWAVVASAEEAEAARARAVEIFGFSPRALRVVALADIPRSSAGKVRYGELLDRLRAGAAP